MDERFQISAKMMCLIVNLMLKKSEWHSIFPLYKILKYLYNHFFINKNDHVNMYYMTKIEFLNDIIVFTNRNAFYR